MSMLYGLAAVQCIFQGIVETLYANKLETTDPSVRDRSLLSDEDHIGHYEII